MNRIVDTVGRSHFRGSASHFRGFAAAVALLLAASCGDDGGGADIDAAAQTIDGAAGTVDAADTTDAFLGADAAPPSPMTFRLTYDPFGPIGPDDAIYVEIACSQMWVRVIDGDGNAVPIDSDCGTCQCDQCDGCAVCDCALLIEPIGAGDSLDHAWNGVTHPVRDQNGCGFCSFESTLPAGAYTARFCYSFTADGASECADEAFVYPASGVVEHVVTAPAN